MSSLALDIFRRLIEQVEEVETFAARAETQGYQSAAPILRRSAFVLAVAGIDTYFHEQAARLLATAAKVNTAAAATVANYLGRVTSADVSGSTGESHIRLSLSYKTLVGPSSIDAMLAAATLDPSVVWRDVAFRQGTRPDRLRLQLQLLYDRRNQIAHEGDWDFVQLDFRIVAQVHLADCVRYGTELAQAMDAIL